MSALEELEITGLASPPPGLVEAFLENRSLSKLRHLQPGCAVDADAGRRLDERFPALWRSAS